MAQSKIQGYQINNSTLSYNEGGTGAVDRTIEDKLKETVSVKDFGAVGDGVTDDTAAIQAAIDSVSVKQKLYFPEGSYFLGTRTSTAASRDAYLFVGANKTLCGPGELVFSAGSTHNHVTVLDITGSNVTIDGIQIRNTFNPAANQSSYGFGIGAGDNSNDSIIEDIENIQITNTKHINNFYAINLVTKNDPNAITIKRILISGCQVYADPVSKFSGAIQLRDHGHNGKVLDATITGCMVDGPSNSGGINIYGVHNFTVTGNVVTNCLYAGIQTENDAQHGTITGNVVKDASRCIWIDDSKFITVSSNTLTSKEGVPPEGVSAYRFAIIVTREGFTGDTGYVTDGITISNNVCLDANIVFSTFGVGNGAFGRNMIIGNHIRYTDANDMKDSCISVISSEAKYIGFNICIGGNTRGIIISSGTNEPVFIVGNSTFKAGTESSTGIEMFNSPEAVIALNNFTNGTTAFTGDSVRVGNRVSGGADLNKFAGFSTLFGSGNPEGIQSAPVSSIFHRTDGILAAPLYFKHSGTGNTGWLPPVLRANGTTANRPTGGLGVGSYYFDTTLGIPIFYNGTSWIDVTSLINGTSTTTAAGGGANALPDNPVGYITVNINGTDRRIPFYATS